ncbi:ABC transporter ATP-binding protein, partial [Microbacterium keratanolyticum]
MKGIWPILRGLLPLLPKGAQRYFVGYMIVTTLITALDVIAMSLLALLIAPALSGGSLTLPFIGTVKQEDIALVALGACVLIILKSALTIVVHWFATRRFAKYELEIGDRMFKAYINSSWEERSKRSVAEITRIADGGIANTMAGFILPLMRVPSSIFTFVLIIVVLFVADPMTSIIALVYLTLIAVIVHFIVTKRALEAA